ncbi:hypothetical protein Bca4012_004773 [Brassica carinata]|uniref:Uncharacterized protein n=1 Tax=Brassica carinata TaxID=52824 RepID=A0A8X7UY68_BRACI|nr:hypothetical protein Bca52824_040790 [Brassica carinata]
MEKFPSPPWVYCLPHLGRVTVSHVLAPPLHCVFASPNQKEAPRIHLAHELDGSDGFEPPPPDAQGPSPNAGSRSIKLFEFVDLSALSSSSIIFRVSVKVKAIHVLDLSMSLRFSLRFSPPSQPDLSSHPTDEYQQEHLTSSDPCVHAVSPANYIAKGPCHTLISDL